MNYCPNCGAKRREKYNFCELCGFNFSAYESGLQNIKTDNAPVESVKRNHRTHQVILVSVIATIGLLLVFYFTQKTIVAHESKIDAPQTEQYYLNEANKLYDSMTEAKDQTERTRLAKSAIEMYQKALQKNTNNTDAKVDMAVCYTETENSMSGISILREVVAENPNHIKAIFNLGALSVRSGQTDKAIERFNRVLELEPKNIQTNFYLGVIYYEQKDFQKSKNYFNNVIQWSEDPLEEEAARKYLSAMQ